MRYRTKPCEIDAIQWNGENWEEISHFIDDGSYMLMRGDLSIMTLEGTMRANVSDYIIRGLRGEYYPCKPDVFEKKYELVEE